MSKQKVYIITASGIAYVQTTVLATSEAEAIAKAKEVPEHDWKEYGGHPQDLEGHSVAVVTDATARDVLMLGDKRSRTKKSDRKRTGG